MPGFAIFLMGMASAEIGGSIHVTRSAPTQDLTSSLQPGLGGHIRLHFNRGNFKFGPMIQNIPHNGMYYDMQADMGCAQLGTCIQGDTNIFYVGGYASYRVGGKGIHFVPYGALQVAFAPLLMTREYYLSEVVPKWSGLESPIHSSPHPTVRVGTDIRFPFWKDGPGFSITANTAYVLGMDL
ncbi:MAG: hypothetical protein VX278_04820, partial [Myxococcota bacterium]|nr:hypothetical protein [Myxococcota bacterium]